MSRRLAPRVVGALAVAGAAAACGTLPPSASRAVGLRGSGSGANDPTVQGARFVPEILDLATAATEQTGSIRGVVDGWRFRVASNGGVLTADRRLDGPSVVVAVPGRLGGGFLFGAGDTLLRADGWLSQPRPIFRSARGLSGASVGLDRIYVRTKGGSYVGLDPTTGGVLDLGPWPADPFVDAYVALDGWHALALTGIQGLVGTIDAGRTWAKLPLPVRGQAIVAVRRDEETGALVQVPSDAAADAYVVSDGPLHATTRPGRGPPEPAASRCFLVSNALTVSPLPSCEEVVRVPTPRAPSVLMASALRRAIEDGWPLEDRSAVIAADGDLVRVSLDDGAVVEIARGAFDRSLGRCHAITLGTSPTPGAFGFMCGAPHAGTTILAYERSTGLLRSLRSFATPRLVEPSGNGGVLVHGPCGEKSPADHPTSTFCAGTPSAVRESGVAPSPPSYGWREVVLPEVREAIAVVLASGDVARVEGLGSLAGSRISISPLAGATRSSPLRLEDSRNAMRRIVERGAWLNGLEERTPGLLSGWLAFEGTVVGATIDLEGNVRVGAFVQDLGWPFVAGRYGLGWTASRQGYETTDGGMTWTPFAAPTHLGASKVRACGPVGCVNDGWLRVGWGERASEPPLTFRQMPPARGGAVPSLKLTCEATEPLPVGPTPPRGNSPGLDLSSLLGGVGLVLPSNFRLGPARPDGAFPAPGIPASDQLVHADVFQAFDSAHLANEGRIDAWGPASGDWNGVGKWSVRWRSPFGGRDAVRSTSIANAPFADAESARARLGLGRTGTVGFGVAVSEDSRHALLTVARAGQPNELFTLDDGGAIATVRREDGAPWGGLQSAVRVGPTWFLAATPDAPRLIEVLQVDDGVARRVASIPRQPAGAGPGQVRFAHAEGGTSLGVLVEGEPEANRGAPTRWVVPVEPDTGAVGAPQSVGAVDLSDRGELGACAREATGWVVDAVWPGANVTIELRDTTAPAFLGRVFARIRLDTDHACVERLAGAASPDALRLVPGRSRPGASGADASTRRGTVLASERRTLPVALFVTDADGPTLLDCVVAAK